MKNKQLRSEKALRTALFILLLGAVGMTKGYAQDYDFSAVCSTGQTLYYKITNANNHYVKIVCPGHVVYDVWFECYEVVWDAPKPTGDIVIPDTVQFNGITYTVTSIGSYAFKGCNGLTGSLTIPNSVTSIEGEYFKDEDWGWGNRYGAFYGCSGFTGSLTIPNSVTYIGQSAFEGCSGFTGSLTIPNSVTSIGDYAFYNCSVFRGSLTIPNSVTSIGDYAFSGCSGITNINIPSSVISIGSGVFRNTAWYNNQPDGILYVSGCCLGYKGQKPTGELCLQEGTRIICDQAFDGCNSLTGSLTIPNSVTTIGIGAFRYCSGFTGSLTIGNSVTSIGDYAFYNYNCSVFTGSLTIPNSVIWIGDWAFYGCSGFTGSLTIGNSVTTIGNSAFRDCSGFTGSLTIPNSVTSIGGSAFQNCSGFTGSLVIPDSVTYLSGFNGCTGFTGELVIPNSVTYLSGFGGCTGFTGELVIPNSVTSIGAYAFEGCSGLTGSLTIPNSVTTIGSSAFEDCSGFTGSLTIPNSVTTIGGYAFYNCSGFTGSLTIGNSVTTIGTYAFRGCNGFTGSLTIPNSVTSIGEDAFYNCSGFTGSLNIGNSVTSIGSKAFYNCSGFTGSLTIGNSVTSIGDNAFNFCSGLTSMTVWADNPPALGTFAFNQVNKSIPVYVPCGTTETYQGTNGWNKFSNIIEMCPGTITVEALPTEGGTVTGGGWYESGATCTLTATANEGYTFYNWAESGTIVSYNSNYSFIVMGDRNLVANFVEGDLCGITFDLYDSFGDGYTGNYLVVSYGDVTEQFTVESGSFASHTLNIPNGSLVSLTWISGLYPEDCSFTVSYSSGDIIYHGENLNDDFMYEFNVNCCGSPDITQNLTLSQGWNWCSTYIEQEGIDGLGQLENSIGIPKAIIQSKDDGYVKSIRQNGQIIWQGALSSINNEEMYKIGTKVACTATIEGQVTDPSSHPITINRGWNSIGIPCSQSVGVSEALSGFTPKNNDMIKGINSYATYSNGTWSGTLNILEPGQGYMYGSKSNAPKTLVFQMGRGEATKANITPENNYYQPTDDYADNMTVIAVVELDGEELRSDNYELAAFAGDECRGSVKLMYVESLNRYVAFLTVFGDETEDMHFVLTDGVTSDLSADHMTYATDGIEGTLDEPVVLRFGTTDVNENAFVNVRVYPNPSKGVFNVEGTGIRKVEVMNTFGQVILSEKAENDNLKINLSDKAAGAYLLRIVTDKGVSTQKLVKE